jgi:prepilin-type N-terminal cleavage/methylation domain-containing protein
MMQRTRLLTPRQGFTLVEMLVSLALTIFLMAIITEAFVIGLEAFRDMGAIGSMDAKLRSATTQILRDLSGSHFEGDKRLSLMSPDGSFVPPQTGFFVYGEGTYPVPVPPMPPGPLPGPAPPPPPPVPTQPEGMDADGHASERDTNDFLHFTVRRNGNDQDQVFFAKVAPTSLLDGLSIGSYDSSPANGIYTGQWIEVVYFLRPDPQQRTTTNKERTYAGLPLYTLYRRELVMLSDLHHQAVSSVSDPAFYDQHDLSAHFVPPPPPDPTIMPPPPPQPPTWELNTPALINQLIDDGAGNLFPDRRFGGRNRPNYLTLQEQCPTKPDRWRGDQLLTDVLSFDVKVLTLSGTDLVDYNGIYDTGLDQASLPTEGIRALQIRIRVWDEKTRQTREVTLLQPM